MEGERRKRKLDGEEASEEQQIEKFFALIKSTKEVRDRLSKEKAKEKAKGVWNPTFQPEDFIDDEVLARVNATHAPAGPSEKEKEAVEKELPEATAPTGENGNKNKQSEDLDLTLSL